MGTIHDVESQRLEVQQRLDLLKSPAERNRWGQFATPADLALDIGKYAADTWLKLGGRDVRFLDPAIGTGAFYSALLQSFAHQSVGAASGVELDPKFAAAARELWGSLGLGVIKGDFTTLTPSDSFNLILTNPPYVRHHHLLGATKVRMRARIADELGVKINGLSGLYCYFMLLADRWLETGGLSIWLVPTEFMTVNYGQAVKDYLLRRVTLLHVHRFCPSDVKFADALVSSAIVVFQKKPPPKNHVVRFTFGGRLLEPQLDRTVVTANLEAERRWTRFAQPNTVRARVKNSRNATLGDFFSIKRGIATGDNDFFILPRRDAIGAGIPEQFCRPVLPSPRYLRQNVVEATDDGYPDIHEPLCLIDCHLPQETLGELFPKFWRYLEDGMRRGVHQGYLASRRDPWYSQETRYPTPFICSYMGRASSARQGNPFRFIWNRSAAVAANAYQMLYPKGKLKQLLDDKPDLESVVFEALASIAGELCLAESRVYGGGLYKLEPKELGRVSGQALVSAIDGLSTEWKQLLFA